MRQLTPTAFAVCLALTLSAQSLPTVRPVQAGFSAQRLHRLHATMKRFVADGQHAGVITLVARKGKLVDLQTYGYRDLEKRLPMEKDTICRIYSMSKIVTSVAVLMLMEEGRFNLDDPVANYLPELKELKVLTGGTADAPQLEPLKRAVTIKHLLTHTSGLIYDFDGTDELHKLYQRAELWSGPDLNDFIRKVGRLPLKHQPGDAFTYGINTDVLGALVERMSGMTFEEFLQERLCRPLKMRDTSFDVPPAKMDRLAKTYKHGPDGKLVEAEPLIGTSAEKGRGIYSGGTGLFSTVGDYAHFAQMLCNDGQLDGERILGRKTVELMTANHLLALPGDKHGFDPAAGFGLGVEVQLDLGRGGLLGSPGAFGWYGAATTYARIDPQERLVAIAFAQHFPFNEHGMFARFATGYYQALE